MAQQSRPGSPVQTHNYPVLLPPWQKCSRSPRANDANKAKKRKIEPSNTNSNEQPTTQINTHNRFAILESSNDAMEIADPPPNNQVKILPTNPEAYRKLTKILRALNANFHTYQLKEERPFRVVLRNIHHSADIDELKIELSKLGHEVTNVSNIRHRVTKDPLSLSFMDLKQKPNNKEIYNISRLMNAIVKLEPPQTKKEIVQCKRCQRYGHTQKYCNHTFRCVKCAGTHPTDQCRKSPETPAKCIDCQGHHPANLKGCAAYKTLYSNKYPKLRPKEVNHQTPSSPKFIFTPIPPTNQTPSPVKLTTPSNSYAQAVQGTKNTPNSHRDPPHNSAPTSPNTDNVSRLEKLIEKQSEQINNLLSLLTLIMDKLIRPDTK